MSPSFADALGWKMSTCSNPFRAAVRTAALRPTVAAEYPREKQHGTANLMAGTST